MRAFLAVFPSDAVREEAARVIAAWRAPGDGIAWVRPANLHWTLRFLGEIRDEDAQPAAAAAREAAAAHAPFDLALGSAGAFPSAERARVLWLGVGEGAEALGALAASLDRALAARGFVPADKPFSPHLTLGRVRGDRPRALAAAPPAAVVFRVRELALVRSTLARGGSRYDVLDRAPLAGA